MVALSNRFKRFRLMPGDSYKLAANILSLFYRPDFSHGPIVLKYTQAGEDNMPKTETLTGEIVLLAVGVSGKRVYGQGKHVLPGNENVCAISDMSMWQRLGLRNMFFRGEHIHHPNTCMCNAHTLRLQFHAPLYFQADGEQRLLQAQDFPLQMRIISVPVDYLTVDPACGQTQ